MIHLTPTRLIAIEVPEDARGFHKLVQRNELDRKFYELWYDYNVTNTSREKSGKIIGFNDFEILGFFTPTEISFDVEPYVGIYSAVFPIDSIDYFRSLLSSHNITDYKKLLILKTV